MRSLLLEAGVDLSRLERNTRRGLNVVHLVFDKNGEFLVVSSTYEGTHSAGSLHYAHRAFDIYPPQQKPEVLLKECRAALGKDWDIVVESNHWHFELDPKDV